MNEFYVPKLIKKDGGSIMLFADLPVMKYLANTVDILLVWYVIYKLIMIVRGTKAVQLLKGIFMILIVRLISQIFHFQTLGWMTEQVMLWGFLAIIIIFQPELRRALEQLGRGKFFSRSGTSEEETHEKVVESIIKAVDYMAKRRIGALISVERETGMGDYVETGIGIDSKISAELLINIFIPNTPLHDGAVILQKDRVSAAACYLPLSESPFISKELGTRHRAAIGISEVTDSITVVVSEETGGISLTKNGKLHRDLNKDAFREMLTNELIAPKVVKQASSARWNWRGKRDG